MSSRSGPRSGPRSGQWPSLGRILCCLALCAIVSGCSTTEEQVAEQIEILAANDVDTENWKGAVRDLAAIGRPGARQLVALLNPALYRGVQYRDFRDEIENTLVILD